MHALFAAGTMWFWIVSLIAFAALYICLLNDSGGIAAGCTLAYLLLLYFVAHVNVLTLLRENPKQAILYVGLYLLAGVGWGFAKWQLLVNNRLSRYNAVKAEFLRSKNVFSDTVPPDLQAAWLKKCTNYGPDNGLHLVPVIGDNKAAWTSWAMWWPISMIVYFLNDLLKDVYNWMYNYVAASLQAIANHTWHKANVSADFAGVTPVEKTSRRQPGEQPFVDHPFAADE